MGGKRLGGCPPQLSLSGRKWFVLFELGGNAAFQAVENKGLKGYVSENKELIRDLEHFPQS
jgi:hypothetical protein